MGGAESWLLSAIDHQSSNRLELSAILLADGPLRAELESRGIPVTVRHVGRTGVAIVRNAFWLRRALRELDPDVALANGVKAAAVASPAALLAGVRSVWVKHDHSFDGRLTRWLGKITSRVVATSAQVADGAARSDVVVLEPARPEAPHPVEWARRELTDAGIPFPLSGPLLAMVGRVVPYKGIDTAIRALALPGGASWHLAVIGDTEPQRPAEKQRLAELAAELGVADRVHITAGIPRAGRLLPAADAVAVLTRPDGPRTPGREGFGITAVEAMVAGLPVVAIDDGGAVAGRLAASADQPAAGIVVPNGDAETVAAGVAAALARLADPDHGSRLGAQGKQWAAAHPDATTQADRLTAILAEAAFRPGAGIVDGPPLSVLSPIRDEISDIDKLIGGVLGQLGPDDEYLIADGGSTDGTIERIEAWQQRDDRIQLIVTPGGTPAINRNAAAKRARHEYIACVDAGCDPAEGWLAGMRAAAAESASGNRGVNRSRQEGFGLFQGVYRVGIRPDRAFEKGMAAVAWPDPHELRRPGPFRQIYGKLLGRRFTPNRVDSRILGFHHDVWREVGGFDETLATAEDEAFGRAVQATGARMVTTLDSEITLWQRDSVWATFKQFRGYGRGGGQSRSVKLLARDGVRVLVYPAAAGLVVFGGWWGAAAVVGGGLLYLSLPISRVFRRRQSPLILLLIPFCAALKDVAKVVGTTQGFLASSWKPTQRRAKRT